ncbi:hypothetical protein T492DRAFT_853542 [Pavlovales sp. CCMP2436]|nr:hypothetical protein T492DRAFT_853542 [Pavlovales sp. CCMP2436]
MPVSQRALPWMRGCGAYALRASYPLPFAAYTAEVGASVAPCNTAPRGSAIQHEIVARDAEQLDSGMQSDESPEFGELKARVRVVLRAYLQRCRSPGYAQGMHLIAAVLLCYVDDGTAFWCLVAAVTRLWPSDFLARALDPQALPVPPRENLPWASPSATISRTYRTVVCTYMPEADDPYARLTPPRVRSADAALSPTRTCAQSPGYVWLFGELQNGPAALLWRLSGELIDVVDAEEAENRALTSLCNAGLPDTRGRGGRTG